MLICDYQGRSSALEYPGKQIVSPRENNAETIDVDKELPPSLEDLLSLVALGTEVVLTEGDIPTARVLPIGKRVAGLHAGSIWISEGFDEPLSMNSKDSLYI